MAKVKSEADEKLISVQLGLTARAFRTRSAELLAAIGLFPGQEQVLQSLLRHETTKPAKGEPLLVGQSMGDLAAELSVRAPTVSKTIARLAAQGLVERQGSGADRRQVRVCLTEDGRKRAGMIEAISDRLEGELIDGLDSKDRKRFRKLLRKVSRNLAGTFEPEPLDEQDETDD